jgi:hypothetical protein
MIHDTLLPAGQARNSAPSIQYRAARISFVASIICLLLILILHYVKADLSPAGHMLSEYAIGDYGWVMQLSFFAWALSCFSLATAIHSQIVTRAGRVGIFLLFITGAALIMGGVFVIDSPYAEPVQPTMHGNLHGLSAMIGLPCQVIAALLISYSLKKNTDWRHSARLVTSIAHLTWISFVLLIASTMVMMALSNGKFTSDTAIGWFNRLLVFACCSWIMITASKAMLLSKANSPND